MKLVARISFLVCIVFFVCIGIVRASSTNGTIDPNNLGFHYAKFINDPGTGSDSLQINFGKFTIESPYDITITSAGLRGYAWSSLAGWIVTNCLDTTSGCTTANDNFKVAVAADGTLSGYAWSEDGGWINFGPFQNSVAPQVKILANGNFGGTTGTAGYAWSEDYGWIIFDCTDPTSCVVTDYSTTPTNPGGGVGGGGGGGPPPCVGSACNSPCTVNCNPNPPCTVNCNPVTPPTPPCTVNCSVPPPIVPIPPCSIDCNPITPPNNPPPDLPPPGDPIVPVITGVINTITNSINSFVPNIAIAEIIATAGIILAAVVSVASALVDTPFLLILYSILAFPLKRKWGVVYDSITKEPIDPAYVTLMDDTGKQIDSVITDLDGRYGFLVPIGGYRMNAQKTNYIFPSQHLAGKTEDEIYDNLYFGESFQIKHDDDIIIKNIPLDQLNFDWNQYAKKKRGLTSFFVKHEVWIDRLSWIGFDIGFLFSIICIIVSPNWYNIVIFALYIILGILRAVGVISPSTSSVFGYNGEPAPFTLVEIWNTELRVRIARKIASKNGRFFALVPKASYYVTISYKNMNADGYTLAYTSPSFYAFRGHIHKKFTIPNRSDVPPVIPPSVQSTSQTGFAS